MSVTITVLFSFSQKNPKMKEHFFSLTYLVARSFLRRSATAVVALLVLLLSLPQRVAAQGCPTLDTGDFTATLIAANSDCHTPARLSVVYRNAVAGFTAMTYSVSKDRTTWGTPVVTPRPGSEAVLPLDGWNEGDPIYIRATATCGTQQPRVVLPKIVYHVKTSADVLATPVVTPAGGCEATSGAVSVSLTGVSGFSRVQYKLERDPVRAGQQAVPVGNLTARSPYQQTLFFNLSPGRYTLHVRATPNCTPTAPGAAWKDGAYEWEQPVDVEHFSVIPTPILTRGTCPGGVTINVAKVVGIGGLRYEIWKKGQRAAGAPALQTATVTYPAFAHTFTGLPLGDYEVRATSTDCEAAATSSFSITQGELVQPQVTIVRHTYAGCAAGKIEVSLPGTTAACPVNFTLTPTAGGTPQVRNNVTTERAQFTGLAAGNYTLTASYGGQTTTAPVEIKTVTPGILKIKPTLAETYCSPTGKMDVTLEGGTLDEPATLELSLDGNPVRSVSLNTGETTKTIEGLLPGGYNVTLRTECGATVTTTAAIGMQNAPMITFMPENLGEMEYCQAKPMSRIKMRIDMYPKKELDDAEQLKELIRTTLTGATYTVRDGDKVIASDQMPVEELVRNADGSSSTSMYLLLPLNDNPLTFSVQMSCGTPILESVYKLNEFRSGFSEIPSSLDSAVNFPLYVSYEKSTCDKFHVQIQQRADYQRENITVKLVDNKTGRSLGEVLPPEDQLYSGSKFDGVPPGEYYYEFWSDCPNAPHHRSAVFTLKGGKPQPEVYSNYAKGCEPTGKITYNYKLPDGVTVTTRGTLYRADGSLVEKGELNQHEFANLAPGKYKLVVVSEPQVDDNCTVDGFTREIEVESYTERPDGTPSYYAKEIQNIAVTLGAFGTYTNTFSFDLVSTPGTYKLELSSNQATPITKTVTIPDNGNKTNKVRVTFNNLPDLVWLNFREGECGYAISRTYNLVEMVTGKYKRPELQDAIHVTTVSGIPGCRKGKIIVHSDLVAMGVPQRPTTIYLDRTDQGGHETRDSITSPNIITDIEIENSGAVTLTYGYNGDQVGYVKISEDEVTGAPFLSMTLDTPATSLGERGHIEVMNTFGSPTDHVHIRITNAQSGALVKEETIVGVDKHVYDVLPGSYNVEYEALDGCYVGQKGEQELVVSPAEFRFTTSEGEMKCANDGVIFVKAIPGLGDVDQVNYEVIPPNGGATINGQTTTPYVPKEFPGLEAGYYTIKATAVVLRGFDGQPHSYEATGWASLSTSYRDPLYVRPAPDKASPAITECGKGGAIGLVIQGSRASDAHVYITETPTGAITPRKEITRNANGSWGQDLAPGNYKLFVTDGCMDIIVPSVTVPNSQFKADVKPFECVKVDVGAPHSGKLQFSTAMSLSSFDYALRESLVDNVELQVVSPGTAPDENNWSKYERYATFYDMHPYDYKFLTSTDRFDFRNGYDILYRFKNCPSSMKRVHQAPGTFKVCNPYDIAVFSVDSCKYEQFVITEYDADRPYRIVVRNNKTNQVIYDQVRTFAYKPRHGDIWENQFRYPYGGEYTMTITSINDPLIPPRVVEITHRHDVWKKEFVILAGEYRGSKKMVSCSLVNYQITWRSNNRKCMFTTDVKVFDKATGTEILPYFSEKPSPDVDQYVRSFMLRRNNEYVLKAYEDGQLVHSEDYTVKYNMPINYKHVDIDISDKCDEPSKRIAYVLTNRENDINHIVVELPAGVGLDDKGLEYDDFLTVLLHDNVNHRTYESHDVTHSSWNNSSNNSIYPIELVRSWNEIKANGDTIKNVVPEIPVGTHTMEVKTSCGTVHTSTFNVIYAPAAVSKISFTDVKYECDGKISFVPTGTAAFPDKTDPVNIISYRLNGDRNTTYNWGDPAETYSPTGYVIYKLEFSDGTTCERSQRYDFSVDPLAFDRANTVSFFCAGAHSGQINVALKGGHKPYIYELRTLDGTLVEKKSAHGAVTFEQGSLGSRYRIEATDSCGLTHVHQDVLLQDPAAISGSITGDIFVCDGDPVRIKAVNFPGATYTWTLPDGTQSHDQELSFTGTPDKAGTYTVNIQLNTCNATITGTYTLGVGHLTESAGTHTQRTCAGQSAVFAPADPVATLNGGAVNQEDLEFQWQYTKTPTDANSWKPIFGATEKSVEYVAAYPGTYYLRRTTRLGECVAVGGLCTLTVDPGITVTMSASERRVVIDHKNPFLLTAGLITGPAARTYVWQRSLDGKTWTDVGTDVSYTETQRLAPVVYYRRIVRSGTCETKGEPITVIFKRRYPAMVNPQLRQRVDQHW